MKIILHRNSRPASPGHLTRKQSLRFAMLDERVRASATSLANDLEEIKRDKLYLAKFPTWEAYCAEVRQIGGRHGNRLIDYVEVKTTLIEAGLEAPASERHAREVKGTKAQQVATWAEVKRRESNGAKITGDLVREINQEILHPPEAEAIARKSRITDAARATIMKAQRERWARVKAQGSAQAKEADAEENLNGRRRGDEALTKSGSPATSTDVDWPTNENGIFTKPEIYHIALPARANAFAKITLGYASSHWWCAGEYGLHGTGDNVFGHHGTAGCGPHRAGYVSKESATEAAWQEMFDMFEYYRRQSSMTVAARRRCELALEALRGWRNRWPKRFPQETPATEPATQEPPSIAIGRLDPGVLAKHMAEPAPAPANKLGRRATGLLTQGLAESVPDPKVDVKTTGQEIVELLIALSWTTDNRHVHLSLKHMREYAEEQRRRTNPAFVGPDKQAA